MQYCIVLANVRTGAVRRKIDVPASAASALVYSPDGSQLAFGNGKSIYFYDVAAAKLRRRAEVPQRIAALIFIPDAKHFATIDGDRIVRLWTRDAIDEPGGPLRAAGHEPVPLRSGSTASALAASPDGKTVVAADGNTLRAWEVYTSLERPLAGGQRGWITALTVSTDGKTLLSRDRDRIVRCWDLATGRERSRLPLPRWADLGALAPDGRTVACAANYHVVAVVERYAVADGKPAGVLPANAAGIDVLCISPDGTRLATSGTDDRTIYLHDLAALATPVAARFQRAETPPRHVGNVPPQPRQIVMPLDAGAGTVGIFGNRFYEGLRLAFTADNRLLAGQFTGVPRGAFQGNAPRRATGTSLRLWDAATGRETRRFALPSGRGVGGMAIAPDGRTVATENADGTVSIWETASGAERMRFGGSQPAPALQPRRRGARRDTVVRDKEIPIALAFSPDGTLLACQDTARHDPRMGCPRRAAARNLARRWPHTPRRERQGLRRSPSSRSRPTVDASSPAAATPPSSCGTRPGSRARRCRRPR